MKKLSKLALVTALLAAAAGAAMAQTSAPTITKDAVIFRGGVAFVSPTSDSTIDGDKTELDSALGPDFNFEYKLNDRFGLEAGSFYAKHDVKVAGSKEGTISQLPLLISGNFHFAANKVDLYVGPTIGYNFWGDFKATGGGKVSADGEFLVGVNGGVDFPLNANWGLTAGLRYLQSTATADVAGAGKQDIDVNPFVLRFGATYRF